MVEQRGNAGQSEARLLNLAGVLLLLVGALVGWLAPRLALDLPAVAFFASPAAQPGVDVNSFLGADITALAVIIAVVIGFNATTLQIAGQAHSLGLVRSILRSLTPFLLCWSVTTGVLLVYFPEPPRYAGQLWQMLCWFAAIVVLMLGYLWNLPWRLSGEYVGWWALRSLRGRPIAQWETLDAYSVLQSAVASASARGDIGTMRSIISAVALYLAGLHDQDPKAKDGYDRRRYRALKNLLSGCAQNAAQGSNATAYHLGRLQAGILLQAVAVGHRMDDADHNLFSTLLSILRSAPDRYNTVWTGLRHGLCRGGDGRQRYLLVFWRQQPQSAQDDPLHIEGIAGALTFFHAGVRSELRLARLAGAADAESAEMALDLYRDLTIHLGKEMAQDRHAPSDAVASAPLHLLDATHRQILARWPEIESPDHRARIVAAYDQRRAELAALLAGRR